MPFADALFESDDDIAAVEHALEITGTAHFRSRDLRTLSGGERQRVLIAAALAQSPKVLLLDEPTTFLDLEHQLALYRLLKELRSSGVTVIAVTHDLNMAAQFAERIVLLHQGRIAADGTPAEVITEETIRSVFRVEIVVASEGERKWIRYGS
jgi:iron complex transport system ATP-binding protein